MKFIQACLALLALLKASCTLADEVPFAQPPSEPKVEPLIEIMERIQFGHMKLWQAIEARNWDLIAYQADRIKAVLGNAVVYYRNIPVEYIAAAGQPLSALQAAAAARDSSASSAAFANLTAACNSCHQAGGIGFIKIVQPTSSPFANQRFTPSE